MIPRLLIRQGALRRQPARFLPRVVGLQTDRISVGCRSIVKVTKHKDVDKIAMMKQLNEDVFRLHAQGHYTQASYAADYAIQKAKENFGLEHVSLASAYANRGYIAKELGELNDAVDLYEEALKIYEKQPKAAHGKTTVLQNLGNVLRTLSNEQKDDRQRMELRYRAKTVLQDAIKMIKIEDGENSLKYASALQKLGNLNKDMNLIDDAEKLLREAIIVADKIDQDSRVVFSAKNDLALVLKKKATPPAFDEARALYESAIEFAKRRFGKEHKETIIYMHNLAELLDTREDTKVDAQRIRLSILMSDVTGMKKV